AKHCHWGNWCPKPGRKVLTRISCALQPIDRFRKRLSKNPTLERRVPGPLHTSPTVGVWGRPGALWAPPPNPHPKCKVGLKHALSAIPIRVRTVPLPRTADDLLQRMVAGSPAKLGTYLVG